MRELKTSRSQEVFMMRANRSANPSRSSRLLMLVAWAALLGAVQPGRANVQHELVELDAFVRSIPPGRFDVSDHKPIARAFDASYEASVVATLAADLELFAERRLASSTYLESARIFLQQWTSPVLDSGMIGLQEYVEKRWTEFDGEYRYVERIARSFEDRRVQSLLEARVERAVRDRLDAVRDAFQKRLRRDFPHAADVVLEEVAVLHRAYDARSGKGLQEIGPGAGARLRDAGLLAVLLSARIRQCIARAILKVVAEKVAKSLIFKLAGRVLPVVGWLLLVHDVATAERMLLDEFRSGTAARLGSAEFRQDIFTRLLAQFNGRAQTVLDDEVRRFKSAITIGESNRLTSLAVHSRSPDARRYLSAYSSNESVRTVVDTVLRVYGPDADFARYEIARKFELCQNIGVANESAFMQLLVRYKDRFFAIAEAHVRTVRAVLDAGENGLVEFVMSSTDPRATCDRIAYVQERLGGVLHGKGAFTRFLLERDLVPLLQQSNATRESFRLLEQRLPVIERVASTHAKMLATLVCRDVDVFNGAMRCLQADAVPERQVRLLSGLSGLSAQTARLVLAGRLSID
jgi:hypothetical protein